MVWSGVIILHKMLNKMEVLMCEKKIAKKMINFAIQVSKYSGLVEAELAIICAMSQR